MKLDSFRLRQLSLASRVTALVGITFLICVLLLGFLIHRSIVEHFAEQDAEEYGVMASAVMNILAQSSGHMGEEAFQTMMSGAVSGHHGVFFGLFDRDGGALYVMEGPDLATIATTVSPVDSIRPNNLHQWSEGSELYRGVVIAVTSSWEGSPADLRLVLASDLSFHQHFLDDLEIMLWKFLACAFAMILLAAWIAVRVGHRPLHSISQKIGNLTTEQLNERLDPFDVPSDLVELVTSFNAMVERMEDLFQRLANASTDIAHELRTPITNLTTQTQVALGQARDAEEYRELLYSNLEEFERMASMINEMLWLARTDNGLLKPAFEVLQPEAEIRELYEYMDAWAEERGITLHLEGSCPSVRGDKSMIRRALSNLLANGIRHADDNSVITIRLDRRNSDADITVENFGDDIPEQDIPRLFDRFYRVDRSRQRGNSGSDKGGTGLGLAIVYSIVTAHGGSVSVQSKNRKTSFMVSLPAAALEKA